VCVCVRGCVISALFKGKIKEIFCLFVLFNFLSVKIPNHGEYVSITIFRTNLPAIFWGIFGIFCVNSKFVFIASMISRGPHNHVLRSPGWKTPVLVVAIIIF